MKNNKEETILQFSKIKTGDIILSDLLTILKKNNGNHIEVVERYCEDNQLDLEYVGKVIKKSVTVKQLLKEEALRLNLINESI